MISYILPPIINKIRPSDSSKKQNDKEGDNREEDDEEEEEQEGEADEEEEGEVDEENDNDGDREADTNAVQNSKGPSWVYELRNILKDWEKLMNGAVDRVGRMERSLKQLKRGTVDVV